MNIINAFYKPDSAFTEIKNRATWVQSFIILSIVSIVVAYFMLPVSQILLANMPATKNLTAEQIEAARAASAKFQYFGLIAVPIGLVFGIAFTSLLIYLGVLACKCKVHFVKIFSLITTASVFTVLGSVVNVVVLYLRGLDAIKGAGDMSVIGLNMLFKVEDLGLPMYQFLAGINIFELGYALFVIFGLSKIADLKIGKSVAVFIFSWAFISLCSFAIAVMQGN
jgi:hypothetical protein